MTAREITPAEATILQWTLDGDSIGLYAIGWPEDASPPLEPADRRLDEARAVALGLVRDGLLEVIEGEYLGWGMREHAVDRALWKRILSEPINWGRGDPERDEIPTRHVRLKGTEAGDRAYLAYADRHGLRGFTRVERLAKRFVKRS